MPWYAISDGAPFHRKILKAGNEAIGAWARAGAWSSSPENLTEGWIPAEVATTIAPLPVWERLAAAGLVEAPAAGLDGYQIHDFLDYNPSAEEVRGRRDELRQKRSEAGKKGNAKRWGSQTPSQEASQTDRKTIANDRPLPLPLPLPRSSDPLLRAPARVESDPAEAETADRLEPPEPDLTLAETFAAEEAKPVGDLDTLARKLAAEGNAFGVRCVGYLDTGATLPAGMRQKLREILEERSRPRPSGIRRVLTLSAEEQALVAVYVAAQKRIRREDVPQLELHGRAAQRILPDLHALARSCSRPGFAPTPADVLEHKLEHYLRISDPRLAAEGWPLGLVLARTDANDLPRPKRKRDPPTGPELTSIKPTRPGIDGPREATPEAIEEAKVRWGVDFSQQGTGT